MEKLIGKVRRKGILKIFFSVLAEILIIFVATNSSDIEEFGIIFCTVLWSIVCIIYFISGIQNIKNSSKNINEYIQKSNYTRQQLDSEFYNAKSFSNLYIGITHAFLLSSDGPHVVPINDIQTMYYRHLGYNPAKGRAGYYYLYLKGEKISDNIKIYYISEKSVQEVMDYLIQVNDKILVE